MAETFYMLSMALDLSKLMRLGFERRMPMREIDTGYLVHMQLGELFGDMAPRPFRIDTHASRLLRILAYSNKPVEVLKDHADTVADPFVHSICDWTLFADKAMPSTFKSGRSFGFELRACPVVRLSKDGTKTTRNGKKIQVTKGAEVDIFVQKGWDHPGEKLSREAVYNEWLEEQLIRHGGAKLTSVRLKAFSQEKLIRRDHGSQRKAHRLQRPNALFDGKLEVTDGDDFASMVREGLGRHRGFGFGMILLRAN